MTKQQLQDIGWVLFERFGDFRRYSMSSAKRNIRYWATKQWTEEEIEEIAKGFCCHSRAAVREG